MVTRYKIIETEDELDKLIQACKFTKYACFDFETTTVDLFSPIFQPTILSVSFQVGSSLVLPLNHFDSKFRDKAKGGNGKWLKLLTKFGRAVIEDPEITKVAWNWKFDNKIMVKYFIFSRGYVIDGMLAKYLLDEEKPNGLKEMVQRYLPDMGGYENYPGSKLPWDKKPLLGLSEYGAKDTDATLRLSLFFEKKLIDLGFYSLFRNLIMMASRVLQEAEYGGMKLDVEFNDQLKEKYERLINESTNNLMAIRKVKRFYREFVEERKEKLIDKINEEIRELEKKPDHDSSKVQRQIALRTEKKVRIRMGTPKTNEEKAVFEPLNLNSQQQMVQLLYTNKRGYKFPILIYTKDKFNKPTNNPSTAEETILELRKYDKDGFINKLLGLRKLVTINSTFVLGIREKLGMDGRIHPTFNIHGTVTGRMCIASNSLIKTSSGLLRIGDIIPEHPGVIELKENYEALTHNGEYHKITHAINKGSEEMFKVTLENGNTIECTNSHIFLTNKGWMKLKDITNEHIICRSSYNH